LVLASQDLKKGWLKILWPHHLGVWPFMWICPLTTKACKGVFHGENPKKFPQSSLCVWRSPFASPVARQKVTSSVDVLIIFGFQTGLTMAAFEPLGHGMYSVGCI